MTSENTAGMQGSGIWFDGLTTKKRVVHLLLIDDVLRIAPELELPGADALDASPPAMPMRHRLSSLAMAEPALHAPLALQLPDGGTLWVDEPASPLALALTSRTTKLQGGESKPWKLPRATRLIASWPAAVACLVASIALVVWFDRQGAALAARAALVVLPERLDNALGDAVFGSIKAQWLEPSTLSSERQSVLEARFTQVAQTLAPNRTVALHFLRVRSRARDDGSHACPVRDLDEADASPPPSTADPVQPSSTAASTHESTLESTRTSNQESAHPSADDSKPRNPDGGFNAFALPNGAIVMLDGMSRELSDDEIMAVLGHELGHVVHRHSMQAVARSFGLLAVAGVVLGDFSSVIASVVATLQTFHYSREAEREADAYGRTFAQAAGLPPGTEAAVWKKLLAEQIESGADALPEWMSTHPPTQERLDAARQR